MKLAGLLIGRFCLTVWVLCDCRFGLFWFLWPVKCIVLDGGSGDNWLDEDDGDKENDEDDEDDWDEWDDEFDLDDAFEWDDEDDEDDWDDEFDLDDAFDGL